MHHLVESNYSHTSGKRRGTKDTFRHLGNKTLSDSNGTCLSVNQGLEKVLEYASLLKRNEK